MQWYQIPEIQFKDYVKCVANIYTLLEGKTKSKGDDDVFMKKILQSHSGLTDAQWNETERIRRLNKQFSMNIGYFHEELAGKFKGYITLPNGHATGCDVRKEDGTEIWEWKNRHNTMNSGSGASVRAKLMAEHERGVKAFLVEVNCPAGKVNRFKLPEEISVLNGVEAYTYLSGRSSFHDDLLATIAETFSRFKTLKEIQKFAAQQFAPV